MRLVSILIASHSSKYIDFVNRSWHSVHAFFLYFNILSKKIYVHFFAVSTFFLSISDLTIMTFLCLPRKLFDLYATKSRGGGGVLPYKGLMGTCGQPGFVFRDFCLKQGIEFINFCLKQDIFSWTINSKIFTSSNVN